MVYSADLWSAVCSGGAVHRADHLPAEQDQQEASRAPVYQGKQDGITRYSPY